MSYVMAFVLALEAPIGTIGTAVLATAFAGPAPAAAHPQIVTIEECQNLQDLVVRTKLAELTTKGLSDDLGKLDYQALVETHWNQSHANEKLDAEIDAAVAAIRADTSWVDRAYSTLSRESAEKFATAVADRVYNGEGFRNALADLAGSIGKDVGARIEKAADKIANPIIACVQNALQARYGSAVAQVFSQETQDSFKLKSDGGGAVKITTGDIALNAAPTAAGIALVVTRRIVGQMVASIGKRVAGMVATRIASSITGLIGLALIAADVYQAGEGVFPIVSDRMNSTDTKDLIKKEIAKTIETDVKEQATVIGQETAERLFSFWLDFKQKYERLLSLSDKNPKFADFLKDRRVDQLAKLAQIASVVMVSEGEAGVFLRATDGSLGKALSNLDAAGLHILAEKRSVDGALRWQELAGRNLEKVVFFELHKSLSPDEINADQLRTLLQVEDRAAMARMVRLDRTAREALLSLPLEQVRSLARKLQPQELDAFTEYQRRLPRDVAVHVLRAVADDARVIRPLSSPGVRQAIFDSRDQGAAIAMLIRQEFPSVSRLSSDFDLVTNGDVHYRVFWQAYWMMLAVGSFVALVILLWLRRLLFGRSPRIVVRMSKDK
jgi:hypothetical protein